jgi:hypothetical protein
MAKFQVFGIKEAKLERKAGMTKVAFLAGFVGLALVGCGSGTLPAPTQDATGQNKGPKFQGPPSVAGLEVKPNSDAAGFAKLVASNSSKWHPRGNPFDLNATEKAYDEAQAGERVFSSSGWTTQVEPKSEVAPPIVLEPQPYRRLSGIVVGDSIVAIIEMGEGTEPLLIHPGEHIPNSPWTVVSIDEDKAVLRRSGDTLPHEVIVRLETPPGGIPTATTTGAPGGFPGAPGGFPGGPGRGGPPGGPGGGRFGGPGGGRFGGPGGGRFGGGGKGAD